MKQLRFQNKVVRGSNVWTISGAIVPGKVQIHEIHGDVNDIAGLEAAVRSMVESSPRYRRVLNGVSL